MTDLVLVETDGPIRILTLNDAARRNPISDLSMVDALTAAVAAADVDSAVRVLILTGAGSAFSSSGDVSG